MLPDRPVRLPLQVGASSVGALLRATLLAAPAAGLVVASAWGAVLLAWWSVPVLVAAGLLTGLVLQQGRRAWDSRPSDAVLGPEGVTFEDGRIRHFPWATLGTADIAVVRVPERSLRDALRHWMVREPTAHGGPIHADRLLLTLDGKNAFRSANARHELERASLEVLRQNLEAAVRQGGAQTPGHGKDERPLTRPDAVPVEVLRCGGCGAPLRPTSEPQATCLHCHAQTPVPESVRELVRVARRHRSGRQHIEEALRHLLRQPGATHANAKLLLAAISTTAVVVACAAAGALLFDRSGSLATVGAVTVLVPVALGLWWYAGLRRLFSRRSALPVLTLGFGALPPARKGDALRCRRCTAPLPSEQEKLLVSCAYCRADNVVALDLERGLGFAELTRDHLDAEIQRRILDGRRWAGLSAGAAVLLLSSVGAFGGAFALEPAPGFALSKRCDAGDRDACSAYAEVLYAKAMEGRLRSHGENDLERACALSHARACSELGVRRLAWANDIEERAEARRTFERACRLGHDGSCLGRRLVDAQEVCSTDRTECYRRILIAHGRCEEGDAAGCLTVGRSFAFDGATLRPHDRHVANRSLEQGCALDDAESCLLAGRLHVQGSLHHHAQKAFRRACDLGNRDACSEL